jgi:hypothetical protein
MDLDVDRAFSHLQAERAQQEQERAEWRQRRAACAHAYAVLRTIDRGTPDDGAARFDVFFCRKCLDQQMIRAAR